MKLFLILQEYITLINSGSPFERLYPFFLEIYVPCIARHLKVLLLYKLLPSPTKILQ